MEMKKLVCPHCSTEMKPEYFTGYYESFPMWSCGCKIIPESRICAGAYAGIGSLEGHLVEENLEWLGLLGEPI